MSSFHHFPFGRRTFLFGIGAAMVGATGLQPGAAAADPDPILEWYDASVQAIVTGYEVSGDRDWVIAWLAAARVLRKAPADPAWQQAALAGAVHQALTTLYPEAARSIAAVQGAALQRIPSGTAKDQGLAAGRSAARALIAERSGDQIKIEVLDRPFRPDPGQGVWRREAGNASMAGSNLAHPFVLERVDQFRPVPPPTLDSQQYRTDLAEVRAFGSRNSKVRTEEQTAVGLFWLDAGLSIYTPVLRAALEQFPGSLAERARLVALFHVALVDTQLATYEAKYYYHRWRPVHAIRSGAIDPDPSWTPLRNTPETPDYPSAHNSYSGCAEGILTGLLGPRAIRPFTSGKRTYNEWAQLSEENVDSRVWVGFHFRTTDLAGRKLGLDVAAYTLRNADRLLA